MPEKIKKTQKKKSAFDVVKKVLNVLGVILILLLMALCVFLIYQRVTGQEPKLFGYRLFEVQTGSMEPTIMTGDTILTKEYKEKTEIKFGDIVVFKNDQIWVNVGKPELKGNYIVHRVVSIDREEGTIITLGDNNHGIVDPKTPISAVEAKYVTKFSGGFFRFIRSPFGLIAIVAALIAIFAALRLVYALNAKRKKKKLLELTESASNDDSEKGGETKGTTVIAAVEQNGDSESVAHENGVGKNGDSEKESDESGSASKIAENDSEKPKTKTVKKKTFLKRFEKKRNSVKTEKIEKEEFEVTESPKVDK